MTKPTTATTQPVVVVINDDLTQLAILVGLLRKQAMDVKPFDRADAAIESMRTVSPDLVVTDVQMPGIDGWRLCRLLRSPEFPHLNTVPILVVSATFAGDEPRQIAVDVGADAFLPAPVDGAQFVGMVRDLLGNKTVVHLPAVLIVEDSRTLAGLLKRTFDSNGYQAEIAGTAREALAAVRVRRYDLAILDYIVPDGKGDQLLDVLRVEQPQCMCLMMTGEPDPDLALDWMRRGATDYLRKPFVPEYLLELCTRARREHTLLRSVELLEARTRKLRESEKRYRDLFEMAPDVIYVLTPDGEIQSLNPAFETATGWIREEWIGKPFGAIIHPDDLSLAMETFQAALQDNETLRYQLRVRTRSGDYRIGEFVARPLIDTAGTIEGVLGLVRDVTERKKAEDTLRLQSLVLDQIRDRVTVTDLNGIITYVNEVEVESLGYSREELIGTSTEKYGDNPDMGATQREILQTTLRDGHWRGEVANRTADGRELVVDCRTIVVHDAAGKAVALCGVATDITKRKRIEQRLRTERDLALALSSADGLDQKLSALLQAALGLSGMDAAGIYFVNPNSGVLELTAHAGLSEAFVAAARCFGADSPQARLINLGQSRYARQQECGLPINDACVAEGLKAIALVPFRDGTQIVGSLTIASRESDVIPDDARVALEALAGWTGQVIAAEQAREALRKSDREYKDLFNGMQEGFALHEIICDPTGAPIDYRFLAVNPAFEQMTGLPAEHIIGRTVLEVFPETEPFWIETYGRVALTGESVRFSNHTGTLGKHFTVAAFQPEPNRFACIFQDVTDWKQAEKEHATLQTQLVQAQKLESVGRLAGGVAHDFNNMLSVILGHSELGLDTVDPAHAVHADLEEIRKAATRSANLTRQLLAFARKQTITPRVLDLNAVVADMHKMLQRLIGESIALEWRPGDSLWPVRLDPSQVDQVLANLCVNARDAIAAQGVVTVSTENCTVNDSACVHIQDAKPGDYVRLTVRDTGSGMDADTLSNLFEPFFTTKAPGEGTGLGLSTVYGITRQNDGFITVQSEPGQGSEFNVFLPRFRGQPAGTSSRDPDKPPVGGKETVLVVEDERAIRNMIASMLDRLGYRVLKAAMPGEAIDQAQRYDGSIDLLLTDVIMPEMNGRVLAKIIQKLYPNIRCVFMSGYTADVIVRQGVLDPGIHFLQKPVPLKVLAQTIRETLNDNGDADT